MAEPEPVRLAAIVGDHRRHAWLVERLAADPRLGLRGIVCERQPAPPTGQTEEEERLIGEHFALRAETEERYFGSAPPLEALGVPVRTVAPGESNDPAVGEWVRGLDAEYLVLFGSSIIREPLLADFDGRTINIHLGLSPYYKGHATNFWPLVNGEPECVGATIHLATWDVDAGPILRQARPEMAQDDGSHDIGCKAIAAGARALGDAIAAYAAGEVTPVPQAGDGRVYRRADFTPRAVAEMRRLFAEGMIPRYLAEKPQRDARFPIVE